MRRTLGTSRRVAWAPAPTVICRAAFSASSHNVLASPPLWGVKHVVCVGSGKGGVGKSTVSANIAVALARHTPESGTRAGQPLRVAYLDADIYGPSVPTLMGLEGVKAEASATETDQQGTPLLLPVTNFGVKCMSTGFLVDAGQALAWRGPMVTSALDRLMRGTLWTPGQTGQRIPEDAPDAIDVMIVDLPPGTGDVHLSLSQRCRIDGALVVSTPQDLALIDAKRALNLMDKIHVPVLGLIENMSGHVCSSCGHVDHVFGRGGVEREAEDLGIPFVGKIPLHASICESSDSGTPVAAVDAHPHASAFRDLASLLWETLQNRI